MKGNTDNNNSQSTVTSIHQHPQTSNAEQKQFVVTPDYIQQSMFVYQPSVIVYNPNCTHPLQND